MEILAGKSVAFIDDEVAVTKPYRDRCAAAGATIHTFEYVTEMLEFIDSGGLQTKGIHAVVADLQMPKPDAVADSEFIAAGSLSGLWLLKQIKNRIVASKVAVVVLTNVGEAKYEPHLKKLEYPERFLVAYAKMDLAAMRLPQVVAERIEIARR